MVRLTDKELEFARRELLVRQLLILFNSLRDRLFGDLHAAGFAGVTIQHSLVLRHMTADGVAMADLARSAGVSRQAIAPMARDLERWGYLSVNVDPTDARRRILRFTPAGVRLARASIRAAQSLEAELEEILGAKDLAALRAIVGKLSLELAHSNRSE